MQLNLSAETVSVLPVASRHITEHTKNTLLRHRQPGNAENTKKTSKMIVKRAPEPITGTVGIIHASHGINFVVDLSDWEKLRGFYWRSKKKNGNWYAYRRVKRDGKTYEIALHRTIAKSRPDQEPHHKNHNTLDNRRCNLENVPHNRHPRY